MRSFTWSWLALKEKRLRPREFGVVGLLAMVVVAVAIANPAFMSAANLRDMLVQSVPAAIVGCGMTFVILTGEIDISVGSMMGVLAAVLGILSSPARAGWPVGAAVCTTLTLGAAIGLVNGLLVTVARIPSIIVTLGMLSALRGVTELSMGGKWITDLPGGLRFFGIGTFAGVPVSVWTAAGVISLSIFVARRTRIGRQVYAVGGNEHAAFLAGLSPRAVKLLAFTFTGLATAVATVVSVPKLSVIEAGTGGGFELLVVTCVVVGGTSISGGRGGVLGTIIAVLLICNIPTMLIFAHLGEMSTYWERAIQGGFILAAVLAEELTARKRRLRAV